MLRMIRLLRFILLMMFPFVAGAQAEEFDYKQMARELGISELRAGVMLHGIELTHGMPFVVALTSFDYSKWQNLSAEILFDLPDNEMMRFLGSPRVSFGGTLNFVGHESMLHLSANWKVPVFETGLFVEPFFGGAINSGYLHNAPPGHRVMGCRTMFYYGANVGYQMTQSTSVMMTYEHTSHNWLCGDDNDGINRFGLRLGYLLD